jgi:hypothetical protein
MLLQELKHGEIRLEAFGFAPKKLSGPRELLLIRRALLRDGFTRLSHLGPMVKAFRSLLQAERDQ